MEYTGGCLCKRVRFRVTAEPIAMRLCWCRLCQYLAAGNATVNVVFPSNALTVEGELTDYRSVDFSAPRFDREGNQATSHKKTRARGNLSQAVSHPNMQPPLVGDPVI